MNDRSDTAHATLLDTESVHVLWGVNLGIYGACPRLNGSSFHDLLPGLALSQRLDNSE